VPTTIPILFRLVWEHPANRDRRVRTICKAVGWQLYKHTVSRPLNFRAYGHLRFRSYPDSTSPGRLIYFGGLPDYDEMHFMKRFLRPGDAYIDGGAHDGLYTVLAASLVGPDGRVDAFEASPKAVARLAENVALNDLSSVTIHAAALSNANGLIDFVIDRGEGNRMQTPDLLGHSAIQVGTVTLDTLGARFYAMGKLDIEGAEPLALLGAKEMLRRGSPAVMQIECVDRYMARFKWSEVQLLSWLDDHGYDPANYDADTHTLAFSSRRRGNELLVIARSRRDLVEDRLATYND
jgi:FkbM family methyltransferase